MRTLNRNKQKLYYALYLGEVPEYVIKDGEKVVSYIDDDGNVYYEETGRNIPSYSNPVPFMANISMSSGEVSAQEYGVDVSNYDAIIVVEKNEIPITETSLLWFENEPIFKDVDMTVLEPKSADYKVLAIKPSLNHLKCVLGRLTK